MTKMTVIEEFFEIGDTVKFGTSLHRVIEAIPREYTIGETAHTSQLVLLEGIEGHVDASLIKHIVPEELRIFS